MSSSEQKCGKVGVCNLHHRHSGLCVFTPAPEGQLHMPPGTAQIGIVHREQRSYVCVDFGQTGPWQWVEFTPAEAVQFAESMIRQARAVEQVRGQ